MAPTRRRSSSRADWRAPYRGARALVTGGAGFLGRHLLAALEQLGAEVHWTTRDPASATPAALGLERGHGHFVDVRDDAALREVLSEVRPAIGFNLAGYGVDPRETDPEEAVLLNDRLVGVLAKSLAVRHDERWRGLDLVHAGSAQEYGAAGGDLRESSVPQPTTLYGRTKLAGTRTLARAARELAGRGFRGATARLFMVYGPGELEGRLVPSLVRAAATRTPLDLTDGTQQRDFTFVVDAIEGLLRLGVAPGVVSGEAVNVATGKLTAVRTFVETAARMLDLPPELLRFGTRPMRSDEMRHDPVAIERAKELLGWSPGTSIEEGLRKTLRGR